MSGSFWRTAHLFLKEIETCSETELVSIHLRYAQEYFLIKHERKKIKRRHFFICSWTKRWTSLCWTWLTRWRSSGRGKPFSRVQGYVLNKIWIIGTTPRDLDRYVALHCIVGLSRIIHVHLLVKSHLDKVFLQGLAKYAFSMHCITQAMEKNRYRQTS